MHTWHTVRLMLPPFQARERACTLAGCIAKGKRDVRAPIAKAGTSLQVNEDRDQADMLTATLNRESGHHHKPITYHLTWF
jgi:hypothetical protein